MAEDKPAEEKHKSLANFNAINDMRVLECAKSRKEAGCKTMLISGDTNLRNIALSANVPALKFRSLWEMLCDRRYQRLSVDQWVQTIRGIESHKRKRTYSA
mmetsp:Transcript_17079/g.19433  ORF Transcript_17079/g.19433 Transcript_17079/m.19433 type:complete len:101 (-) Transcript_17079:722-1024(-)